MSNQPKNLRAARAKPASAGPRKKRPAKSKSTWLGTWARLLFIIAVVGLPLLAAGLIGPSIEGGSRWQGVLQGMNLADNGSNDNNGSGDTDGGDSKPTTGGRADFGPVSVRLFNPITRCRMQANFDLKGVTLLEDGPALNKIIKNKYRFIREQATIAIRNSNATELIDPNHELLQRRIRIRINRSLDHPLLKTVKLDHFKISESTPELDLMGEDADGD